MAKFRYSFEAAEGAVRRLPKGTPLEGMDTMGRMARLKVDREEGLGTGDITEALFKVVKVWTPSYRDDDIDLLQVAVNQLGAGLTCSYAQLVPRIYEVYERNGFDPVEMAPAEALRKLREANA